MTAPETIQAALVAELLTALADATDTDRARELGAALSGALGRETIQAEQAQYIHHVTTVVTETGVSDVSVRWAVERLTAHTQRQDAELRDRREQPQAGAA